MPSRRQLLGATAGTAVTLAGCLDGAPESGNSAFRSDRLSVPDEYTLVAEADVDEDDGPGTVSKLARAFERSSDHPTKFLLLTEYTVHSSDGWEHAVFEEVHDWSVGAEMNEVADHSTNTVGTDDPDPPLDVEDRSTTDQGHWTVRLTPPKEVPATYQFQTKTRPVDFSEGDLIVESHTQAGFEEPGLFGDEADVSTETPLVYGEGLNGDWGFSRLGSFARTDLEYRVSEDAGGPNDPYGSSRMAASIFCVLRLNSPARVGSTKHRLGVLGPDVRDTKVSLLAPTSATRNALLTTALLVAGYVLPFVAEHLRGPRGPVETLAFLAGHTYFHYYLNSLVLTALVMGGVWYAIESRVPTLNFFIVGAGYGLVSGLVFAVFYVLLGIGVYGFQPQPGYVFALVVIGLVVGLIAGALRARTTFYRE